MKKMNATYVNDILLYTSRIEEYTRDGETEFYSDRKTQDAVVRNFEIIGEIVKRLPQEVLDMQPELDWKSIKVLISEYDNVDLKVVWDAVARLSVLRTAVESTLAILPLDDAE